MVNWTNEPANNNANPDPGMRPTQYGSGSITRFNILKNPLALPAEPTLPGTGYSSAILYILHGSASRKRRKKPVQYIKTKAPVKLTRIGIDFAVALFINFSSTLS